MKKIALTLLVACLCLEAGCSRPTAEAPVVAASPTPIPRQLTEEEQRQEDAAREALRKRKEAIDIAPQPAVPMTEDVIRAASPSPTASPRP